jgi:hypothetical protein
VGTQPIDVGHSPARAGGLEMRASDADRDRIAGLLTTALAEGRLTADEHDQRVSSVFAARTWQQLELLTADLPVPRDATAVAAARQDPAGPDLCLLCLLLIACPPAGIAWWLRAKNR